jgi:hypothetical protein
MRFEFALGQPKMGGFLLRKWILTAAIVALPTCSLAQVQSRVDSQVDSRVDSRVHSRVESRVFNGFDDRERRPEEQHHLSYPSSSCWRAIRIRGRVIAWNCQPYP